MVDLLWQGRDRLEYFRQPAPSPNPRSLRTRVNLTLWASGIAGCLHPFGGFFRIRRINGGLDGELVERLPPPPDAMSEGRNFDL